MKITVLEILRVIFESEEMKDCWSNFVELLTLRVINAHCDEKKEVCKVYPFRNKCTDSH